MDQREFKTTMLQPEYRSDVLPVTVQRIYTDVNFTVVDKNDPAIPDALKVSYPVYLFGEFDRQGAYELARKNNPPDPGTFFLFTGIWAINNPFFAGFSGLSDVQRYIKPADLVTVYTDNILAPTWYVFIVLNSATKPLASVQLNMANLPPDPAYGYIKSDSFRFTSDNSDNQWKENIQYIRYNFLGLVKSNNLDPSIYQLPKTPRINMVEVKWKSDITQYIGLNTYILFDTNSMTFTFNLKTRQNDYSKI